MLKKIVKYGNSKALVLDKAILELLNIRDEGLVKIRTDGISLIITPQRCEDEERIFPTATVEDKMSEASKNAIIESFNDSEKGAAYYNELKEISDRYLSCIQKGDDPLVVKNEMVKELAVLSKKYQGVEAAKIEQGQEKFANVHEKFKSVLEAVTVLQNDPQYIHEMMLLGEKYASTNSKEYFAEYTKLVTSYVPEYATYQSELQKVGDEIMS